MNQSQGTFIELCFLVELKINIKVLEKWHGTREQTNTTLSIITQSRKYPLALQTRYANKTVDYYIKHKG